MVRRIEQNHYILWCLCILLSIGCSFDKTSSKQEIEAEVRQLENLDEKKLFLENILSEIQSFEESKEAARFSGSYNAEKFEAQAEEIYKNAFLRISAFFEEYGYPSRAELGQYAAFAPYAVVYFSDDTSYVKKDQFKYFYGAFRFNDLPEEAYLNYLLIYYNKTEGQSFYPDRRLSIKENIYLILDDLGVDY